jgi:hypothetical protein
MLFFTGYTAISPMRPENFSVNGCRLPKHPMTKALKLLKVNSIPLSQRWVHQK